MSTKTEAQLANEVLQEMGVIDAGETLSSGNSDFDRVVAAYENKYAELSAPGFELTYWTMTAIPQSIFTIVRDLVINEVQGSFGNPMPAADKAGQELIILRKLRRHTSVQASGLPVRAEYF